MTAPDTELLPDSVPSSRPAMQTGSTVPAPRDTTEPDDLEVRRREFANFGISLIISALLRAEACGETNSSTQ